MNLKRRKIIENVANVVKKHFDITRVKTLDEWMKTIEKMGGMLLINKNLFCDAKIYKISDDGENGVFFKIEISPNQSQARINFSIAHELGHLFLHMFYRINYDNWRNIEIGKSYNRIGNNEIESQANEFAAEFLMPKVEFLNKLEEYKESTNSYNIQPIADYFGVSEQAVLNRGKWLGVFAW